MDFRKMGTIALYGRQKKTQRCIEESFGFCGRGEDGMTCGNGIETCILSHVTQIISQGLMHDPGCSGLMLWDNPEGWDGEGGGKVVQDGEHMYTHGRFLSMYGKTNIIL